MANHFISGNRGKSFTKQADFTFDTSSTAGDDMELRIADGASLTRLDVVEFLEGLERMLQGGSIQGTNFPDK